MLLSTRFHLLCDIAIGQNTSSVWTSKLTVHMHVHVPQSIINRTALMLADLSASNVNRQSIKFGTGDTIPMGTGKFHFPVEKIWYSVNFI